MKTALLTRTQLAEKWSCSSRKIDRLRKGGLLPWIDMTGGVGNRPIVRFKPEHITEFENKYLMDINK